VPENALITTLRDARDAKQTELDGVLKTASDEQRNALTTEEAAKFDAIRDELRSLDGRIADLVDLDRRQADAAEARRLSGDAGEQRTTTQVKEPDLYVKGGPDSYFRDLFKANTVRSQDAVDRLNRHASYVAQNESRAVGNTNAAGGSGGEWAPPAWIVDEWIGLIRPGRITANLFRHEDVPKGISSLNYPKLLTGTTVALQSTQNSALSSTDPTTGFVQTGFSTLGGKNVISQQLIDQGHNFDAVMTADLAAAYAAQVGTQVYTGTGAGTGTNAVINGLGAATIGSVPDRGRVLRSGRPVAVEVPGRTAHAADVLGDGAPPLVLARQFRRHRRPPAGRAERCGVQPDGDPVRRFGAVRQRGYVPRPAGLHRPADPDQRRRRHQPGQRVPAQDGRPRPARVGAHGRGVP
jgi:HK97 family phage major capsid protein